MWEMTAQFRNATNFINFVRIAMMRAVSSARRGSASIKIVRTEHNASPVGVLTLDVEIAMPMHVPLV